jgi:molybdate transport system permease protein
MKQLRTVAIRALIGLAVGGLAFLLVLPIVALLVRTPPEELLTRLGRPEIRQALLLSLETSLLATGLVLLLGLPTAYLLASRQFPGKRIAEVLVELPMVIPPTVAGLILLLTFGRTGLLGKSLTMLGVSLPFTTAAVVVAQAFMAAPFFLVPVRAGFTTVEPRYREVAATLGASELYSFFRVMLPLSLPSVVAGTAMACARALGEFGATITFAGNLPGVTQTMPLAVYVEMQHDLGAATTLSVLLILLSFGLLLALRYGQSRVH